MKMTKKLVMLAAVAVAFGAWAETATVGGYTWTYQINGDTAEIYNNYSTAISPSPTGAVTIPSTLGGKPVTSIGDYAFEDCYGLTSVTIPSSVTSIGNGAFSGCSDMLYDTNSIPGVMLVDSWAVDYTDSLSGDLDLTGVRGIADGAFCGCTELKQVTIPDTVTRIGEYTFSCCEGLSNVVIPASVTEIGEYAFDCCTKLVSVTLPAGVSHIGEGAFNGCGNLTTMEIPSGAIGCYAFSCCTKLAAVTLGAGVTDIGDCAFEGCSKLASITIPDCVTHIAQGAFQDCNAALYDTKTIPGVILVDGWAVGYDPEYSTDDGCSLCGNYIYLDLTGCLGIAGGAFEGWERLREVTMPPSVMTIGEYAFGNCKNLWRVTLGSNVRNIGDGAFYGCKNLQEVTVPESFAIRGGRTRAKIPSGADDLGRYCDSCECFDTLYVTLPSSVSHIGASAFSIWSGDDDDRYYVAERLDMTLPMWSKGTNIYWDEAADAYRFTTGVVPASSETLTWPEYLGWEHGSTTITYKDVKVGGLFAADSDDELDVDGTGVSKLAQAQTYDGYLYRSGTDGVVTAEGTIQLKVGKPNARTGAVKLTGKLQLPGGAKKSLKGTATFDAEAGYMEVELTGGEVCMVRMDNAGVWGVYGNYRIWCSRNIFASRDSDDKAKAARILAKRTGTMNGMVKTYGSDENCTGIYIYSATVGNKGKIKIAEIGPDGKKVSASGQMIYVGEGDNGMWCALAMGNKAAAPCLIAIPDWDDEKYDCWWEDGDSQGNFGWPKRLQDQDGELFWMDEDAFPDKIGGAEVVKKLLPHYCEHDDGITNHVYVRQSGTKWVLPKAGKVSLVNGQLTYGENPSGLKLTYKAKDGSFKGSFSVYTIVGGRLKKTKAAVTGAMIGHIGYGMATIRNVGFWPIDIGGD